MPSQGSGKLRHQVETNEFFTRLAEQARLAGGALREWYGERTTCELLGRAVIPDGYGVLALPGKRPAHILLELDRGTERPYDRLAEKARRYAAALPKSDLRHVTPLVLFAVPNEARARGTALAIRPSGAPASTVVWTPSRADRTLPHVIRAVAAIT